MASIIINDIPNIENLSYLELGVDDNSNFNAIKCINKESVDINGNATFTGTTDEYFSTIGKNKKFDIIYIDANHNWDYVLRDFNNSVDRCNHWILMHDMIPPTRKYTKEYKCSTAYQVLYYMLTQTELEVYPMYEDFGLTLIKMPGSKLLLNEKDTRIEYSDFIKYLSSNTIYTLDSIKKILGSYNV